MSFWTIFFAAELINLKGMIIAVPLLEGNEVVLKEIERKMLAELLVASAPNVKMAQDIAARMGLLKVRFPMEDNRCILCGLCIRMCYEQMDGKALICKTQSSAHSRDSSTYDKSRP
jgi:ferredoxin